MNDQVPPGLRKRGITHAVNALAPDQDVRLPAGGIFFYFRDELLERFVEGGAHAPASLPPKPNRT